ncbi:MAG: preprotein translocase subunit SecE [Andreesenia angusta]|nr:preprotein translocase subunit SecE [Andreesenia angusta]
MSTQKIDKRTKQQQNSNFLKSVKAEFKKITWPTKEELINHTIVVLVFCIFISLFVWLIDLGLHQLLAQLMK